MLVGMMLVDGCAQAGFDAMGRIAMKKRYWILIAGVAAAGGAVFVRARDSSTTTLSDEIPDVKRGSF